MNNFSEIYLIYSFSFASDIEEEMLKARLKATLGDDFEKVNKEETPTDKAWGFKNKESSAIVGYNPKSDNRPHDGLTILAKSHSQLKSSVSTEEVQKLVHKVMHINEIKGADVNHLQVAINMFYVPTQSEDDQLFMFAKELMPQRDWQTGTAFTRLNLEYETGYESFTKTNAYNYADNTETKQNAISSDVTFTFEDVKRNIRKAYTELLSINVAEEIGFEGKYLDSINEKINV